MSVIIPLDNNLSLYDFEIELNSILYKFNIEYVARCGFWIFSLFDAENYLIASGIPQTNYELFKTCTDDKKPAGTFWLIDTTGQNQDITRDNLGNEIIFVFESSI